MACPTFTMSMFRQVLAKRSLARPILPTRRFLTAGAPTFRQEQPSCITYKRFYNSTSKPPPVAQQPKVKTFTWKSAVVLVITAVGLVAYFRNEKEKLHEIRQKRERDMIRSMGKPNIGQPFELVNVNEGKVTSSKDLMEGQYTLIYFGFTHCPDICPEELDKMAEVVDAVKEEYGPGILTPVFITCDPLRDTEEVVREYVKDFHPDLIGFTGEADKLKQVARSYRVYSYTPPNVSAEDDYLVDHSIFFYLMDPNGQFVDCYARDKTPEEVLISFRNYIQDYLKDGGKLKNYAI